MHLVDFHKLSQLWRVLDFRLKYLIVFVYYRISTFLQNLHLKLYLILLLVYFDPFQFLLSVLLLLLNSVGHELEVVFPLLKELDNLVLKGSPIGLFFHLVGADITGKLLAEALLPFL